MNKALVRPDMARIYQIVPTDKTFPVAPPLEWIDVPDDVTERHTRKEDGTFEPEPVPAPEPPSPIELLIAALIRKGVLSKEDLNR
jgi:hypothetical protein